MEAVVSGVPGAVTKPEVETFPEFYLIFLKVEGAAANWIRIDQITHIRAVPQRMKNDVILPEPYAYRITVWTLAYHSWTVMDVDSLERAEAIVERVMVEISMRLPMTMGGKR